MSIGDPVPPPQLSALAELSAQVGQNPDLIQAAGGNTSIKDGDVMWIKASGTLLAEARRRDIFVPVDLPAMQAALERDVEYADKPQKFTLGDTALRPSIETSLHALFAQKVVVHVHCVNTISVAIRADAEAVLRPKLCGFSWALAGYQKPGAHLAREVRSVMTPDTDVVVLKNHGLLIAANTVEAAEALLQQVVAALFMPMAERAEVDGAGLERIASAGWEVPPLDHPLHQLALSPVRLAQATKGSLYPDHVIFCGIGAQALDLARAEVLGSPDAPVFYLVPQMGTLVRRDATPSAWAMMRCLADVLLRTDADAPLTYLSDAQNHELIDWDAEKYRKALDV